jgi:metallo-beta-lactamase family protein
MCDAGRIRHHLKNHLWRSESTILLVGYQAEGTLGRLLEKGVRKVKIQGEEITVRAQVRSIDVYSGHADGAELVLWMQARQPVRQSVFLTHGSEESLAAFRDDLVKSGFDSQQIIIPNLDDEFELLLKGGAVRRPEVRPRLSSEAIGRPDWHNEYAELSLNIRSELESKTDAERKELLKRLKSALYTS